MLVSLWWEIWWLSWLPSQTWAGVIRSDESLISHLRRFLSLSEPRFSQTLHRPRGSGERMKGMSVHVVWTCHDPCHSASAIPHFLSQIRRGGGLCRGTIHFWSRSGGRTGGWEQILQTSLHLLLCYTSFGFSCTLKIAGWTSASGLGLHPSSLPSLFLPSTGRCILPGHPALVCEGACGIYFSVCGMCACMCSLCVWCVWCGMQGVCVCAQ